MKDSLADPRAFSRPTPSQGKGPGNEVDRKTRVGLKGLKNAVKTLASQFVFLQQFLRFPGKLLLVFRFNNLIIS